MKKLLLILLLPISVSAAPFLICNPVPVGSADTFAYQEGTVIVRTPLVNNACHADLSGVSVGSHTYTVWLENSVWGTASATVPFTYSRPAAGGTGPSGMGISSS
jgi:hypothetical protein